MKKFWFMGLSLLLISSCDKAPDLYEETIPGWKVSIIVPEGEIYNGDTISLGAVVNPANNKVKYYWKITDPDGVSTTAKTAKMPVALSKIGDYQVSLEASIGTDTKTAADTFTVHRRGIVISLAQKGGQYLSGDNLQFDSLGINCRITTTKSSLGRFSLSFGDKTVLDTVVDGSQAVISHKYEAYGTYSLVFINSETISKSFTIKKPGTPSEPDTTVYDEDLSTYNGLSVSTTHPDAMFAKVDLANKKIYVLFSVDATERTIGPGTTITLKSNWAGKSYGAWDDYYVALASACVVTTAKGQYIKLALNNPIENFTYRANMCLGDGIFINAQNASPFYGLDEKIGDTGTFRFVLKGGKLYPPQ